MIDRPSSRWKWLAFLSILIAIGALFAGFRWHVLRERKKTRKATKEFGDRLDDRDVHERLRILRLEKVLGLERIRTGAPTPLSSHASRNGGGNGHRGGADRFDEGKKNRFRDLLLPSRRRQGGAATDVEMSLRGSKTDQSNFAPDRERQRESAFAYGIPPPPYVPSASSDSDTTSPWPLADRKASSFREHIDEVNQSSGGFARRDSLDSIPTPVLPSFTNWSPTPHARFHSRTMSTADGSDKGRFSSETKTKTKTIVHSMASSPSPTSKFPTASVAGGGGGGGLMPPPRPGMMGTPSRLGSYQEKQRPLHRSIRSQSSIFGYPSNTLDGAHDAEHGGSDGLGEVDVDFERRLGELWPYMKAAAEESQEQQQEHHKSAEAEGRRQEEGWI
ncbi:hypothetical protein I317_07586 [Kwoniella heveanensis CBS 569]|nr:hypothetical protein I317_07586 [Kwoniella heveanensis CBS 569]